MRVLHVITSLNDGGAEAVLFRLVSHNPENMHEVICLTNESKYGALLRNIGVKVTTLDMPRGQLTVSGLLQLWRGVKCSSADVIQTWMYHADLLGGIVGKLAGVPVVWGIRSTTLNSKYSAGTTWIVRTCALLSRRLPARIVACANAALQVHGKLGYDLSRMAVIPNGYDLSRFAPDGEARVRLRSEWSVTEHIPVIGMVGRFDPYKDHSNLITALGLLKERGRYFKTVLVGMGIDEHNRDLVTQIQCAGLNDKVQLLGEQRDIPKIMSALDIHTLSSFAEAFPNVLAEAMACGTPCVATDVGDAAFIVRDTGWIVPPRDSNALANAIESALSAWQDREAWRCRQVRCRERIGSEFDIKAMVRRYCDIWVTVVNNEILQQ